MHDRLLDAFKGLFDGRKYNHRKSNLGDHVVSFLYEDLHSLGRSPKIVQRINARSAVLNIKNVAVGQKARRGDGTFGEAVPGAETFPVPGLSVARGLIASVEIGAESKILAKAMIKQIDRVITDLKQQTEEFRRGNPRAICVGVVGINQSEQYTSFEGKRRFATDGKKHKHPAQEAEEAELRLLKLASPHFDELVILRFSVTNKPPYPFSWQDETRTRHEYAAALVRLSKEYEARC